MCLRTAVGIVVKKKAVSGAGRVCRSDDTRSLELPRAGEPGRGPVISIDQDALMHRRAAHACDDETTGLPNRRSVVTCLERALQSRAGDERVTFAFVDLDGFKEVNDVHGHSAGDALLAAVGARIRAALPEPALVGRFGGDEFAIVMVGGNAGVAARQAQVAVDAVSAPFWLDGQLVELGASSGLASAPTDGTSADALIRRAGLALRPAMKLGRGRTVAFEPAMELEREDRHFLRQELRRAIEEGALALHYQPIVAADGTRMSGVEALLRWSHPTRGPIAPDVFVPVAEESGLMERLGEFVLRKALIDARRWPNLYVAVNVSPVQMRKAEFIDLVAGVMAETAIAPERVMLEVTEGVLIDNPDEAQKRLDALRSLGVRIALDDFGVGYSSLSYLQRFPFDKLKIDKGFVNPLGQTANGAAIIQSIVALGRALGLSVLAEGVETEEQRVLLRLAGCHEMQGYLFAKPAPRETIDRLVARAEARTRGARA
jgi:diguanylate cyclase (GGDEF)-like protein